jgi:CBS domain containing-hemolysin-like protein
VSPTVWLVLGLLVLANALYVAAEFGAVGVRRSRVRRLADDGGFLARRLLPSVDNAAALDRYVGASQIGITLASLVLGAYAQATIALAFAPALARLAGLDSQAAESTSAGLVLAVLTAAQVVIGELVPKSLALQFPTQVALATVLPMRWSLVAFSPLIWVTNGSAVGLLRLLGVRAAAHHHIHSPDEIELMIAESRDGGLLEADEQQRLHRALRLGLRSARDLMVPLDRLTMLELGTAWEEVVRLVAASPYSRLPVYRGARDQIVGTLRVKDLLHEYVTGGEPPAIERLLRPVVWIAHDVPADRVITILRDRRTHQAVVTDASGRASGLLTIQDVLAAFLGTDHGREGEASS